MLTGDHLVKLALLMTDPQIRRLDITRNNDGLFVSVEPKNLDSFNSVAESVRGIVKKHIANWYIDGHLGAELVKSWWCGPELQVTIACFNGFEQKEKTG